MKNNLWLIILGVVILTVLAFHFFLNSGQQEPVVQTAIIETREITKPAAKGNPPTTEAIGQEEEIEGEIAYEESKDGPLFLN